MSGDYMGYPNGAQIDHAQMGPILDLCRHAGWVPTLKYRRLRRDLIEVFFKKITHGIYD